MTNERYQMKELLSAIENAGSILLFSHISPDGDTLGSALALKMLLERLKKSVTIVLDGLPPQNLLFLPDVYCVRPYESALNEVRIDERTLAISVDVSCDDRMGKALELFNRAPKNAQIDHHGTNPAFAQINLIDGDAPATAVLIFRLFEALNMALGRDEAICLYTALSTDTGNFVYENVNAEAFRMMSVLMEAELPLATTARLLFRRKEKPFIALLGVALPTMRYLCDGAIAGCKLTLSAMRSVGATKDHTDGLVDYAIDGAGVKMAYFARETEEGRVKFSLRALAPHRIDGVAAQFGGGGHAQASGCTLDGPLDAAVATIEAALTEAYRGGSQA